MTLRELARLLNGTVSGAQVLCAGPGHSRGDNSLCVKLSPSAPLGFIVYSFASDPFDICQSYVAERLGLDANAWKRDARRATPSPRRQATANAPTDSDVARAAARAAAPLALWRASVDPRGTPVELYLKSRGLELGEDVAGAVLRWNAEIGAMLALFRDIRSNEPRAVSRTYLDRDACKLERKFLGPVGGAVIKLDGEDAVLDGL